MIYYSIIIPHKNIPSLLQRCLNSIPVRDDVQVIVVDDDSAPDIVDFDNFPGARRPDIEIYFTKEGKGAGYARNVGLQHAVGKWLVFCDADDLFSDKYNEILSKSIDSECDILFYNNLAVHSDDISRLSDRDRSYANYISEFVCSFSHQSELKLRYCFQAVWGKVIRKELVDRYNIKFDETKWSNDVYFSAQIGFYSRKIAAYCDVLYIVSERDGSLTSRFCYSAEEYNTRMKIAIKTEKFYSSNNIETPVRQTQNLTKCIFERYGYLHFIKTMVSVGLFSDVQAIMLHFFYQRAKHRLIRCFGN